MAANWRCLKCPVTLSESEVFDTDTPVYSADEEEQSRCDEVDPKKMKLNLMCMKSMVDKYVERLQADLPVCPNTPCIDDDVALNYSKNEEISKIQRDVVCLNTQIGELVGCCKTTKAELQILRTLACDHAEKILGLQKHVAELESWRRTLEFEAGLCIERFEYLKHVKAEWSAVVKMLNKDKKCFAKNEARFVPRSCYAKDKAYFIDEVKKLKQMFRELYELQNTKFNFYACADTPTRGSDFNFATQQYLTLKKAYNDRLEAKEFPVVEKAECE